MGIAPYGFGVFPEHLAQVAPLLEVRHVGGRFTPGVGIGVEFAVVEPIGDDLADHGGGVARGDVLSVAASTRFTCMLVSNLLCSDMSARRWYLQVVAPFA